MVIIEPGGIATEFGDVMNQPLLDRSKGGAYEEYSKKVAKYYENTYADTKRLSSPDIIAKVVSKIVESQKPKTRYVAGYMSKQVIFMRWLLSDRLFEKMIERFI